ncbi:SEC-C domain-containing protein [Candidatus Bathyarchaeota archaeon]|nr:SEC-C domain-containing protein [Candidatus Bathyarchaeota archaeon]
MVLSCGCGGTKKAAQPEDPCTCGSGKKYKECCGK